MSPRKHSALHAVIAPQALPGPPCTGPACLAIYIGLMNRFLWPVAVILIVLWLWFYEPGNKHRLVQEGLSSATSPTL